MDDLRRKQMQEAEELLFSGPQTAGFAKELFFGRFLAPAILPYPQRSPGEAVHGDKVLERVREFAATQLDPVAIDQSCDIPPSVIRGLGAVGVLGATVGTEWGGEGLTQSNYCRVMEIIGGRCAATAVFVNAHHSIGLRALEMFGTPAQKKRWLAPLAKGEQIAAFALTEAEAGSDAGNVQTIAKPNNDGDGFILNGGKRYITNGGIAHVLTVMARTPDPKSPDGKVTAFLVTPDMPGFEVLEARMPKCGIRGTATARLAFHDMPVPRKNILGEQGKGLKLALTVLDFGRTTFGASCTGAAKFCVEKAVQHANQRKQFGKTLGEFGLVQQKIAEMAAHTFAMESATYQTAALIDRGAEDYMVETAMLKVFASDMLWQIVNDTLQIYGGAGYFNDQPFERMMRDARINLIGEGANDVLRCFIAGVGLRALGLAMQGALTRPWKLGEFALLSLPQIPISQPWLQPAAARLARQISSFGRACQQVLVTHGEAVIDAQGTLARVGDIATELFHAGCVYSRLLSLAEQSPADSETARHTRQIRAGLLYLSLAHRRNAHRLSQLFDNDDWDIAETARFFLKDNAGL